MVGEGDRNHTQKRKEKKYETWGCGRGVKTDAHSLNALCPFIEGTSFNVLLNDNSKGARSTLDKALQ